MNQENTFPYLPNYNFSESTLFALPQHAMHTYIFYFNVYKAIDHYIDYIDQFLSIFISSSEAIEVFLNHS